MIGRDDHLGHIFINIYDIYIYNIIGVYIYNLLRFFHYLIPYCPPSDNFLIFSFQYSTSGSTPFDVPSLGGAPPTRVLLW